MESLKISVDLKRRTNEVLSLQQGYTYPVELSVFDNGTAYTCTGATAQVHFLKSTGKFSIKTTDITINGNKVSFKLDNTLINRGGVGQLQVVLTKGGDVFGSWAIHCNVFANVIQDEATEDSNIIDVLGDLTKNIAKADPLSKALEKQIPQATPLTNSLKTQIPQATELVNEMKSAIEEGGTVDKRELGEFKKGYTGKEYADLNQRVNGDIDHVQQQINDSSLLPYEGTNIKADNTYYGLTKDTVIKGRTLQNLCNETLFKNNTMWSSLYSGAIFESGYIKFTANGTFQNFYVKPQGVLLKPSSVYTVVLDIKENTLLKGNDSNVYFIDNSSDTPILNNTLSRIDNETGILLGKIETRTDFETAKYSLKSFINKTCTEGILKLRFMILEGDHTNTPIEELPFVEGIQGTGDTTKNLFKKEYIPTSISEITEYIPIDSSKTYIISNQISDYNHSNGAMGYLYTYNENKEVIISGSNYWGASFTGASFVRFRNGVNLKFYDTLQLEEGTQATPYEPYYEGYKISGKSCGKNLVTELRKINTNNLKIDLARPIKNGESFQFSFKANGLTFTHLSIYCENSKTGVSDYHAVDINTLKGILTARNDYDYIKIYCTQNPEAENFKDLMVAITPTLLPYEPYQESTYSYILDEPLMQLPNRVADSINLETGVLTRRVGKVVLDGSENYSDYSAYDDDITKWFRIAEDGFIKTNGSYLSCISDEIPCYTEALHTKSGIEGLSIAPTGGGRLSIRIKKSKLSPVDVNGFKEWLQNNPIILYYELVDPTTEQLEPTQLKSFEGTTHIVSNNTLQATTSVKIPSNVQMVVQNLRAENKALNVELKDTKAELENTDLDILEMNWETDFRVCELEYAIYSQEARAVSLKTNSRAISKYDQAKTLIEANRYNKTTMTRQLTVYLERGYITEEEYQELIAMME